MENYVTVDGIKLWTAISGQSKDRYIILGNGGPGLYKEIAGLKMPALFLGGATDIRPLWPVEQVQALLENPELVIAPGAQHCIWMTHYEEMKVVVRRFLRVEG